MKQLMSERIIKWPIRTRGTETRCECSKHDVKAFNTRSVEHFIAIRWWKNHTYVGQWDIEVRVFSGCAVD